MRTKATLKRADVGGDAHVARRGRAPAPRRRPAPFTAAITGWWSDAQPRDERGDVLLRRHARTDRAATLAVGRRAVAGQVEPGAEAPALAGDHDGPAVAVAADLVEGGVELRDERRRPWR